MVIQKIINYGTREIGFQLLLEWRWWHKLRKAFRLQSAYFLALGAGRKGNSRQLRSWSWKLRAAIVKLRSLLLGSESVTINNVQIISPHGFDMLLCALFHDTCIINYFLVVHYEWWVDRSPAKRVNVQVQVWRRLQELLFKPLLLNSYLNQLPSTVSQLFMMARPFSM